MSDGTPRLLDRLAQGRAAPLFALVVGAALFLPRIGSFGLWDPQEVRIADVARDVANGHAGLLSAASAARHPSWPVVVGFRMLGSGELGGRLPIALLALLALFVCYRAAAGVFSRRAALFASLALLTSPAFFLGARQLTSDIGPTLCMLMAVGGLARFVRPAPETSFFGRMLDLTLALAGLWLGFFSSGAMLGVATPLAALAVALFVTSGASLTAGLVAAAAAAAWLIVGLTWARALPRAGHPPEFSWILAGIPHNSMHAVQLVTMLRRVGFGAFPWVLLLPLAAARAFAGMSGGASLSEEASPEPTATPEPPSGGIASSRPESAALADAIPGDPPAPAPPPPTQVAEPASRYAFGWVLASAWLAIAYVAATLQAASIADLDFPAIAAVALLAGAWLDEALDAPGRLGMAGLILMLGAAMLAHDFFQQPESWAGAHVTDGIKWPSPEVDEPFAILGLGLAWGVAMGLGCALLARPGGSGLRRLLSRHGLFEAGFGIALVSAAAGTFWVIPALSHHLSFKNVFEVTEKLDPNAELAKYRVTGSATIFGERKTTDLSSTAALFEFLAKPARVFALVGADELASIDQYAKSQPATAAYYVVDDSNVHYLLLSNKLDASQQDKNPLRRNIVKDLPKPPQHAVSANFENKLELVGYDLPAELERGRKFKITLYYKVLAPVGGAYKIFVHFDGPGSRFNGDHVGLDGKFPTNYWVPGFYIIDEHEMEPDRATAPAGWYQIYTGLWMGDSRLKVTVGGHDGENRFKLGSVRVK